MSGLGERDRARLWHPYTQMKTAPMPLPVVRAEGVWLFTEDGRRILDGISSWWVNLHGHGHPRIAAAVARQALELDHVQFAGCTHRPAVELAERLCALLPAALTRVFYSDDGSTAVEVALKMAWQYWRNCGAPERSTFVAFDHAYHGDTVGAMSASADGAFTAPFDGMRFRVERVHDPYCFRCPVGRKRESCAIECLGSLESALDRLGRSVAAVILEPMLQGAGGMIVWPKEFLAGARRACDRVGTLLIADEVLTGFGRTGTMFACEHAGVTPDLICLSKGLTGGFLPLAATACTEAIYEAFLSDERARAFFHGHSYTANPIACAAALASLEVFRREPVLERVRALEAHLRAGLEPLRSLPHVGDVRVLGGVGAVELLTPGAGGYLDRTGPALAAEFLRRGLLLRPLGNVVYFMPPYAITLAEADWALGEIRDVLARATPESASPAAITS